MKLLVPEVLPEWFLLMNDKSLVSSSEIVSLFGFKSISCFKKPSAFPRPDVVRGDRLKEHITSLTFKKGYWKKDTILKEIERRKKLV